MKKINTEVSNQSPVLTQITFTHRFISRHTEVLSTRPTKYKGPTAQPSLYAALLALKYMLVLWKRKHAWP